MNDQAPPANDGGESESSPPPVDVTEPRDAEATQPATKEQLADVEKQMTGFEKATLRWAKLAVGMSGVAALFVCLQWYEMHTAGTDTHDLSVAAKTQADKMKSMSDAADKIRQAAENMVIQDQRIADNAAKGIEASTKQSKRALDTSIQASHSDQRAWVAEIAISVNAPEVAKPIEGWVAWRNTGKTFAIQVRPLCYLGFVEKAIVAEGDLVRGVTPPPPQSIGVLAPNADYRTKLATETAINDTDKTRISGTWYTYVWGQATYDDVFRHYHRTVFCSVRQGPTGDFVQCPFHNEAD